MTFICRRRSARAAAAASPAFKVIGAGGGGNQQAGFEPRQPSGHHQPVGRQLQADEPGVLDHRQILVDQRQDGDFREVQLL